MEDSSIGGANEKLCVKRNSVVTRRTGIGSKGGDGVEINGNVVKNQKE